MEENKKERIVEEEIDDETNEISNPVDEEDSVETEEDGDTLAPSNESDEDQSAEDEGELGSELSDNEVEESPSEEIVEDDNSGKEKMLTQSQVNEIAARAREEGRRSAMRELLERYGVGAEDELNDVFGKGQAYDGLNDDYESSQIGYKQVMAENALLKTRIDPARWEDVRLILGGSNMDVTPENIELMLPSHPEWRNEIAAESAIPSTQVGETELQQIANNSQKRQIATLRKLGSEPEVKDNTDMEEEERAMKLYGFRQRRNPK